ncbi:MAG: hypothetical protein JWM10_5156, partial [Myxococcaceae bacterium]|nr:hypothetical protein [Myxococcaceae bacterium]
MSMVVLFGSLRRVARVIAAPAVTLAVAARVAGGAMRPGAFATVDVIVVVAGVVGVAVRVTSRRPSPADGENPPLDLGVAALCLALVYALTAALGGLHGPLSALPLLALAAAVSLGHPKRAWVVALGAVALELALHRAAHATLEPLALGLRLAV